MVANNPQYSVVVPVRNEADNIAPLIAEIRAAMVTVSKTGHAPYEIVYVDDGSDDATAKVLREQARDCPELRIVRHARPAGQSAAIITGGSYGIGKAAALSMAREGARVILVARRADVLDEACQDIKTATEGIAIPVVGDVSDHDTADRVVKTALDTSGG